IVREAPLPDGAVEDGLQQLQMVVHGGDRADFGQGCLEVLHVLRSDVARETPAERTSQPLRPRAVVAVGPFTPPAVVQIVGQDLLEDPRPVPWAQARTAPPARLPGIPHLGPPGHVLLGRGGLPLATRSPMIVTEGAGPPDPPAPTLGEDPTDFLAALH